MSKKNCVNFSFISNCVQNLRKTTPLGSLLFECVWVPEEKKKKLNEDNDDEHECCWYVEWIPYCAVWQQCSKAMNSCFIYNFFLNVSLIIAQKL